MTTKVSPPIQLLPNQSGGVRPPPLAPWPPSLFWEKSRRRCSRVLPTTASPKKSTGGGVSRPPSRYSHKTPLVGGGYWSFLPSLILLLPPRQVLPSALCRPVPSASFPSPQEGPLTHMAYYHGEPAPLAAHGHHPQGPAPRCLRSYMRPSMSGDNVRPSWLGDNTRLPEGEGRILRPRHSRTFGGGRLG